ncbi:tumor necrosis factor receptor superfamily member 10D isoform X3 [Pan troglodytes]|uniref:tumor necrosis factor receptor superfamily member 10D isoform X3 n=1 Tax=Pan troglodytes TaxID=9598 RepID=UPI0007DBCFE4
MEKVSDCTPLSDINCKNESAASSTGKTPAAEETVTTILGMLASPFLYLIIIVVLAVVVVCILCRKKFMSYLKGICSGGGGGPERVHRVLFRQRSCPSQVPGAEDKAHNETLSNRYLQPTQISEQEIQGQELAEPTGVTVESPEEPQRLLSAPCWMPRQHWKKDMQRKQFRTNWWAPKSSFMKKMRQALLRPACERISSGNQSFPHLPFLLQREAAWKKQSST